MPKTRVHNEWFQPLKLTSCPCGCKKTEVFAWGEYVNGRWCTVGHFCKMCFSKEVVPRLIAHAGDCGCTFELRPRCGYSIPKWIKMPALKCAA